MVKKIVFRIDGGSRLRHAEDREKGMGHVTRCVALAKKLKKNFDVEVIFMMKNHPAGVEKVIDAGYAVERLPVYSDREANTEQIFNALNRIKPQGVVNDILNTEEGYMSKIKETGAFIINVDDLGPGRELADALVYSLVRPPASSKQKIYAGPAYMTLKEEFKKMHEKKKIINRRIKRILVSMGASDPQSLTVKVLSALEKVDGNFTTTVVIGQAFTHHDELKKVLDKTQKKYIAKSNINNMAELMHDADIAIISGGVSVYELAAVGTPGIILCQNKHENTNVFEDYGFAIKLGLGKYVSERQIIEAVEKLAQDALLRQKMSGQGKKLVDGRGAERVAKIILERCS
jgi:UDP-2,4-diacetamido-2,4,6-trideoxy-beta-L-altropyranose hydrolase